MELLAICNQFPKVLSSNFPPMYLTASRLMAVILAKCAEHILNLLYGENISAALETVSRYFALYTIVPSLLLMAFLLRRHGIGINVFILIPLQSHIHLLY